MAFNTALSGLKAASEDLRVIGNNVANASTTGFKSARAEFADVYANAGTGGGNTIGSGVILADVKQQFSQGQIKFTNNNLDLAVNGEGFFILNDNGTVSYSRSGAFGVDKDGYISNALNQRITGFLADSIGNITGAQGDLRISTANLSPRATSNVDITVNLDAEATPPTVPFARGFTTASPPNPSSFNTSTSTTMYDSLGNPHIMTSYFVKAPSDNAWRVYIGVDGTDVTPAPSAPPGGALPASYGITDLAHPFSLVFDNQGSLIPNNTAAPPLYYGPSPVISNPTAFSTSGTLSTIDLNDLTINGVPIDAASSTSDIYSTTDTRASSIATATAINNTTSLHGVTAAVNPNVLDLGIPSFGDLDPGDLTLNNIPITGVSGNETQLLALINAQNPVTGILATQPGGAGTSIILTAADGRNIQVQTDGAQANGTSFANFDLNSGALDQVQRGTVSLANTMDQGITIGGTNPLDAGLSPGPLAGIIQSNSDVINIPNWNPIGGALAPQIFGLNFNSSTQFGAPFSVQALSQDGYSTGRLSGVDVDAEGVIFARYSNGQSLALGGVALANFGSIEGLAPQGDSTWVETFASGPALIGAPGTADLGVIQASALEESNVALTDELVKLIVAQRNFQANAQTIRTADAVTQTIINIR